jgi:hypothetical protein
MCHIHFYPKPCYHAKRQCVSPDVTKATSSSHLPPEPQKMTLYVGQEVVVLVLPVSGVVDPIHAVGLGSAGKLVLELLNLLSLLEGVRAVRFGLFVGGKYILVLLVRALQPC